MINIESEEPSKDKGPVSLCSFTGSECKALHPHCQLHLCEDKDGTGYPKAVKFCEIEGRTPELSRCSGSRGNHTRGTEPLLLCLSFQDELFSFLVQRENGKSHLIFIAGQEGCCHELMKTQECRILSEKLIAWLVRTVSVCICVCMCWVYACLCTYIHEWIYAYIYVHVYVHACVGYMYACVYTWVHAFCINYISVAMTKYTDKNNLRKKGFVWLTILCYSPSSQGGQGGRKIRPSPHIHSQELREQMHACYYLAHFLHPYSSRHKPREWHHPQLAGSFLIN